MKTTAAISPMMANVLAMAKIPPMAVKLSQVARIPPTIFKIIRPMPLGYPVPVRSGGRAFTGDAADPLPDEASVAVVPRVPLDHVPMSGRVVPRGGTCSGAGGRADLTGGCRLWASGLYAPDVPEIPSYGDAHRLPEWYGPPQMVGGYVTGPLLISRSDRVVVAVRQVIAFPAGVEAEVEAH